jgi:competence ComEA-like helix-hairpin-helix protein
MEWLKGFFYFTKAQLRATIILCLLILLAFILPHIYLQYFPPQFSINNTFKNQIAEFLSDTIEREAIIEETQTPFAENADFLTAKNNQPILFSFNPNEITHQEWIRLGFSEKQAAVIEKIKSKGFVFRTVEDLKKINIIGENGYERLKNYVILPEVPQKNYQSVQPIPSAQPKEWTLLQINKADSASIEKLPGIGAYFTKKILTFRNALGGFATIEQLAEIKNLPDSTFQKIKSRIKVEENEVQKLNVNLLPADTLARHPYISLRQANIIVAFRSSHGKFKQIEDVQRAGLFSDSLFQKLKPYLSVE